MRYGDWNSKNRALWEETQRLGGNKYREIYKRLCYERKDLLNSKEKVLPDAIPSGERDGQGVQKEKD
jgi:hypothetical protein